MCRRLDCTDERHRPNHERVRTSYGRTISYAERKRNKQMVDAWLAEHGAWCPFCGEADYYESDGKPVQITADHVTPLSQGGDWYGPIQPMCRRCQARQGAKLANRGRQGS